MILKLLNTYDEFDKKNLKNGNSMQQTLKPLNPTNYCELFNFHQQI